MLIEVCTDVDYDVDDIISCMTRKEKQEMFDDLAREFGVDCVDEDLDVSKFLAKKPLFEQKKILCKCPWRAQLL